VDNKYITENIYFPQNILYETVSFGISFLLQRPSTGLSCFYRLVRIWRRRPAESYLTAGLAQQTHLL
jgi:hypothetical protein